MRILFVSGAGITADQRINRWKMVSSLYAQLGHSFRALGHETYYYVHPEAWDDKLPPNLTWTHPDHEHFGYVLESFLPDFVFCWNGSSPGDLITSTMASAYNAKMVFSEQGWFPQKTTLYFDLAGTNARCGTRTARYQPLNDKKREAFLKMRADYIAQADIGTLFDKKTFRISKPDLSRPVLVPLQDERDLNIVQDSPFQTMDAFVRYLVETMPGVDFRVRPHPKFATPNLSSHANVTVDNPKKPMFQSLSECGLVVGINSTTLLESALLGKPVISLGESLGSGTGLFHDHRPGMQLDVSSVSIDTAQAEAVLAKLLKKQMLRDKLAHPPSVLNSDLFQDLRQLVHRKAPLTAGL